MKATSYMKQHKANEFYVKKSRGYYIVIDGYDKSMASLEVTEEAANKMAAELNAMRGKRKNHTRRAHMLKTLKAYIGL